MNENNKVSPEISIAIFPFENFAEGKAEQVFCRSFYIDLITELSRFRQFRIIAYDSLKNIPAENPEIAFEHPDLKADYLIRGSFYCQGDLYRIHAQLISAVDRRIAWADRFEGRASDIFLIQEDILKKIVSTLQLQLDSHLLSHIRKKNPTQLNAYELWLYGMEELKKGTPEADEVAREYFRQAIEIDPGYSFAYSGMSLTYFNEWSCQLWERWDVSQKGAYEWARKAFDLDENNYVAAYVLGRIHVYEGEYELGEHYLRTAVKLNPNCVNTLVQVAISFTFLGYIDEAAQLYAKVLQLNPLNSQRYYHVGAFIAFEAGDFEKCVGLGTHAMQVWVDFPAIVAAAYYHLGDYENMERWWKQFFKAFGEKIVRRETYTTREAVQWIMNVNPYRGKTNLKPFFDYMLGEPIAPVFDSPAVGFTVASGGNYFRRENGLWEIRYDGKLIRMPDAKGLSDIARLIEANGTLVHCTELMGSAVYAGKELAFDTRARKSYQQRIQELKEEIELSESNNDLYRTASLQEEYDHIVNHLSSSLALNGSIRKIKDPVDRVRSAVTWRIRSTIRKIQNLHPLLGRHLTASVRTGTFCSYNPERPMDWWIEK